MEGVAEGYRGVDGGEQGEGDLRAGRRGGEQHPGGEEGGWRLCLEKVRSVVSGVGGGVHPRGDKHNLGVNRHKRGFRGAGTKIFGDKIGIKRRLLGNSLNVEI